MNKIIYFLIIISALAIPAFAQTSTEAFALEVEQAKKSDYTNIFIASWNTAFPFRAVKDFTNNNSFRGGSFEYRKFIKEQFSVGFGLNWQRFYEARGEQQIDYNETTTLWGKQFNYSNLVPILATFNYYPCRPKSNFSPLIGFGIGTYYNEKALTIGGIRFARSVWHFGLAPEAGAMYEFKKGFGVLASVRYNYAFAAKHFDDQSYLGTRIGMMLSF